MGFAQVLVIVSLLIVSGMLTAVLSTSAKSSKHAELIDQTVRANIATGSAFRRIVTAIEEPGDDLEVSLVTSDTPVVIRVDGVDVAITLEGEGGKINPALAKTEILDRYLASIPLSGQERTALASQLSASRHLGNATLAVIALKSFLIPQVGPTQLDEDFSTINRSDGVDPQYASSRVLSALPDLDPADVAKILSIRKIDPSSIAGMSSYFRASSSVFSLATEIAWDADRSFTRRIPFEITPAGKVRPLIGFLGAN